MTDWQQHSRREARVMLGSRFTLVAAISLTTWLRGRDHLGVIQGLAGVALFAAVIWHGLVLWREVRTAPRNARSFLAFVHHDCRPESEWPRTLVNACLYGVMAAFAIVMVVRPPWRG